MQGLLVACGERRLSRLRFYPLCFLQRALANNNESTGFINLDSLHRGRPG